LHRLEILDKAHAIYDYGDEAERYLLKGRLATLGIWQGASLAATALLMGGVELISNGAVSNESITTTLIAAGTLHLMWSTVIMAELAKSYSLTYLLGAGARRYAYLKKLNVSLPYTVRHKCILALIDVAGKPD
jgi:hypothetical protein